MTIGPDIQVGPLAGIIFWTAIVVIAVAMLFSTGLGGAAVFVAAGLIVLAIAYAILSRLTGRLFGRRGGA